ncbi:MAG: hypothetical protein A2Y17_02265 [Clostridiales bacterium GWF2_38_85]|nr:MAG: hypothetical protein A2Y17_02265 [Clostridiales bacterium GWF2_38_85]
MMISNEPTNPFDDGLVNTEFRKKFFSFKRTFNLLIIFDKTVILFLAVFYTDIMSQRRNFKYYLRFLSNFSNSPIALAKL